ncbi:MAG: sugar phosphate isomerase/epimerase [Ruminococcaceae bacterium]|nr:sugar phosphate isomerase/epimerase [Oscillospiraceae bacterium]
MMKIGIGMGSYTRRYGLEEGLRRLKAHGYDALDYSAFIHTENPIFHVSSSEFAATLCRERELIEANGLFVGQTHGAWRCPARDASEYDRAERFAAMVTGIRGTALLGAPYFVIHCIMPFGENNPDHRDELWEMNAEYYERLCKVAEDCGVTLCLENLPFTALPLSRTSEVLEFVRMMNTPTMKICLDTGHAAVYGDSPADMVRMIGKDYLATLHVHDNDGRSDYHWRPGEGVVDWVDFGRALHEIGFDGVVNLETGPVQTDDPIAREQSELELAAKVKAIAT